MSANPCFARCALQLRERVRRRHVRHQSHVDLGDRPVRQHRLAAGAGVSADQPFDVDRRLATPAASGNPPNSCRAPSAPRLASACTVSSEVFAACSRIIFFCAAVSGRAFSKNPSTAGVWPSVSTSVFNACTRCQVGESTCASRLECMSCFGPAAPLLAARDQLELHHALRAERHLDSRRRDPARLPA